MRAAREVVSPNVCRIFDLVEADGTELVSMEFVDGTTLLEVLHERGPLELKEAQDIASQFLAGLEAIHRAGLVHRDVKPENIMITRAGRVVVMDFGLARQEETEAGGTVSGTPAYMAPEQAAGQAVDARADVYAAGVVLAEMVSPDGIKNIISRQTLWEGVRSEPPQVPDTPWAPVIKLAVDRNREQRYRSAHTLTRALEDVTLRVEGAEDLHPYPGLASFTEQDAGYFFGREAEVEAMWAKLEGSARMLAIMGPSGAGKTSFIRAGLTPSARTGWTIVRCTPGRAATASLRSALTPELTGDAETLQKLVADPGNPDVIVDAVASWRRGGDRALLVVDQFEELFTLNPPAEQAAFAALLGRLPLQVDVHVVLSMRDDFAASCNAHESLRPIFHELTVLDPPTGANLRRALIQPATKCGYRFEDDELVERMLAEVEGERGALPMLAFAAAKLWEMRDRENGVLTRQAYRDIGGVGGALAKHAEATIDRVGSDRVPIVRELFRNLVTAEGTRAVREWDELLSVFSAETRSRSTGDQPPGRKPPADGAGPGFTARQADAEEVLGALIDSRLLTSYEVHEEGREPTRRVEIIHESLLEKWPRLVRWSTQDADAAQLRDELRHAARQWDQRGRTDDRLWTGSAYREFMVWRERYPGGLTELEEAYAKAMTSHATRRLRQRRYGVVAAFIVLLAVAGIVTISRQHAVSEAKRAEAARLLALGRLEVEDDNIAALAWAMASLDMADTIEARHFAVECLWHGPTRFVLHMGSKTGAYRKMDFSPDGRWLAASSFTDDVLVWPDSGGPPVELGKDISGHSLAGYVFPNFSPRGDYFVAGFGGLFNTWTVPDWELIRQLDVAEGSTPNERQVSGHLLLEDRLLTFDFNLGRYRFQSVPYAGGTATEIGWWDPGALHDTEFDLPWQGTLGGTSFAVDPSGNGIMIVRGNEVFSRPFNDLGPSSRDRLVGKHPDDVIWCVFRPTKDQVACLDKSGVIRFWSVDPDPLHPVRTFSGPEEMFTFGPSGKYLINPTDAAHRIWDLTDPFPSDPLLIPRLDESMVMLPVVDPTLRWLVAAADDRLLFWPVGGSRSYVLTDQGDLPRFAGASLKLISDFDGVPHILSLGEQTDGDWRPLLDRSFTIYWYEADLAGKQMLVAHHEEALGGVYLAPIAEKPSSGRELWPPNTSVVIAVAFSQDGRLGAAGSGYALTDENRVIRVWDLENGEEWAFNLTDDSVNTDVGPYERGLLSLRFTPEGDLLSAGYGGVRRWSLETGDGEWLIRVPEEIVVSMSASRDSRILLTRERPNITSLENTNLTLHDLERGTSRRIVSHGEPLAVSILDATGTIVATAGTDGIIRVGPADGSEPHFLFGHKGAVIRLDISADGRWIVSGGSDNVRLWPMPDLSKPPLHTLPYDELMAKLESLTNIRVVRDEESGTGWKQVIGPFPGWAEVPTW